MKINFYIQYFYIQSTDLIQTMHSNASDCQLIDVLRDSKTGLSGIEISEKLKINRLTMTKYLQVFAAEGFLKQKNIGNVNLWFMEEGVESL